MARTIIIEKRQNGAGDVVISGLGGIMPEQKFTTLAFVAMRNTKDGNGVIIQDDDRAITIYPDNVLKTIVAGTPTNFTGNQRDLLDLLYQDFFFQLASGGGQGLEDVLQISPDALTDANFMSGAGVRFFDGNDAFFSKIYQSQLLAQNQYFGLPVLPVPYAQGILVADVPMSVTTNDATPQVVYSKTIATKSLAEFEVVAMATTQNGNFYYCSKNDIVVFRDSTNPPVIANNSTIFTANTIASPPNISFSISANDFEVSLDSGATQVIKWTVYIHQRGN